MEIHFVLACDYYYYMDFQLKSLIVDGMKKYKIKKVMVTIIFMLRERLITKEEMEDICKGNRRPGNVVLYTTVGESINDD